MVTKDSKFDAATPRQVACIIVAGGSGTRCGGDLPKQFSPMGSQPVLAYSIAHFDRLVLATRIIIVVSDSMIEHTRTMVEELHLQSEWTIVAGGVRRQDSVLAGLKAAGDADVAMIHDGARPFPPAGIEDAVERAAAGIGVVFAMPATDSIKRVDGERIIATVPRHDLWAMQTPQIFPTAKLIEALQRCDADNAEVTDDASAFEHLGWPVEVAMGSRSNLKITYPEDFLLAEAILKAKQTDDQ